MRELLVENEMDWKQKEQNEVKGRLGQSDNLQEQPMDQNVAWNRRKQVAKLEKFLKMQEKREEETKRTVKTFMGFV